MASSIGQTGSDTAGRAGSRSVVLIGPYGSGKSALFEHLLGAAGAPIRRPLDPRGRTTGTEIAIGHCSFMGDPGRHRLPGLGGVRL